MTIYSAQMGQAVYGSYFAKQSTTQPAESSVGVTSHTDTDTVTISSEAKELSAKKQVDGVTEFSDSDLPIEALALPSWYGDLVEPVILNVEINHKFWNFVGKLTEDNYLSGEERGQIRNYLQNDSMHQEQLAKNKFTTQYQGEIQEYLGSLNNYFKEALKENGVNSNRDYYEKVVLDTGNSEKIHQSVMNRIENDHRILELMETLGVRA